MVALAVAIVAGPGLEVRVEALVAQAHFVIQERPAGHHAAPGLGTLLPVIHVVLLKGPRGTKDPCSSQAQGLLDVRRGCLVDVNPRPDFGLVGSARMPDAEGA